MIRINLLPHREEKRKARRQQFYAFTVLVVLLAGAIWFVGFGYINNLIDGQSAKNEFLKREIATLKKQIEEIEKLKEQTNALLARKQVIESLQANRSETVHLLNELVKRLPEGTYLRSIKQEQQRITLIGIAESGARVSTLMQNLDASPVLTRPVLVEIKAADVGKRRMNQFTLTVQLVRQTVDAGQAASGKPAASKPGAKR